jgi:hypothetical protein
MPAPRTPRAPRAQFGMVPAPTVSPLSITVSWASKLAASSGKGPFGHNYPLPGITPDLMTALAAQGANLSSHNPIVRGARSVYTSPKDATGFDIAFAMMQYKCTAQQIIAIQGRMTPAQIIPFHGGLAFANGLAIAPPPPVVGLQNGNAMSPGAPPLNPRPPRRPRIGQDSPPDLLGNVSYSPPATTNVPVTGDSVPLLFTGVTAHFVQGIGNYEGSLQAQNPSYATGQLPLAPAPSDPIAVTPPNYSFGPQAPITIPPGSGLLPLVPQPISVVQPPAGPSLPSPVPPYIVPSPLPISSGGYYTGAGLVGAPPNVVTGVAGSVASSAPGAVGLASAVNGTAIGVNANGTTAPVKLHWWQRFFQLFGWKPKTAPTATTTAPAVNSPPTVAPTTSTVGH